MIIKMVYLSFQFSFYRVIIAKGKKEYPKNERATRALLLADNKGGVYGFVSPFSHHP